MLTLDIGTLEHFDSTKQQFVYEDVGVIRFEYSLKVVYEWESKWRKPFLNGKGDHTEEQLVDLYHMMALDPLKKSQIDGDTMQALSDYVSDQQTATTFRTGSESGQNGNKFGKAKVYSAEELYALMFNANIPLDFENRNLNRLLIILKIMASYNKPPKKMSKQDILKQNSKLNEERKKRLGTRG